MKSDFPHPLNTVIEEEVPVLKNKVSWDDKGKRASVKSFWEMEKQQVMYFDPDKEKISCASGEHSWKCKDIHSYLYVCKRCKRKIKLTPVHFDVIGDKIISRLTGEPV